MKLSRRSLLLSSILLFSLGCNSVDRRPGMGRVEIRIYDNAHRGERLEGATLFLDGDSMGRVNPAKPVRYVLAGTHSFRVEKLGYAAFERSVRIHAGDIHRLNIYLEREN